MKSLVAVCCMLIAIVAAKGAVAGPPEENMPYRPFAQPQSPRGEPQRDAAKPVPPPHDMRGADAPGRMSPDERRQLRRDIQDVGRDIYRRDRQSSGRQQRR